MMLPPWKYMQNPPAFESPVLEPNFLEEYKRLNPVIEKVTVATAKKWSTVRRRTRKYRVETLNVVCFYAVNKYFSISVEINDDTIKVNNTFITFLSWWQTSVSWLIKIQVVCYVGVLSNLEFNKKKRGHYVKRSAQAPFKKKVGIKMKRNTAMINQPINQSIDRRTFQSRRADILFCLFAVKYWTPRPTTRRTGTALRSHRVSMRCRFQDCFCSFAQFWSRIRNGIKIFWNKRAHLVCFSPSWNFPAERLCLIDWLIDWQTTHVPFYFHSYQGWLVGSIWLFARRPCGWCRPVLAAPLAFSHCPGTCPWSGTTAKGTSRRRQRHSPGAAAPRWSPARRRDSQVVPSPTRMSALLRG